MDKASHPDGSILLFCEVQFVPYNINCEINGEDLLAVNTLQKSIKNMFEQGTLSDCFIKVNSFVKHGIVHPIMIWLCWL
uniref:Uncharacterized protein n=1 Tax=Meloidogyne hapla TaxID=6305 RepID=A0A1I8B850_MELHA